MKNKTIWWACFLLPALLLVFSSWSLAADDENQININPPPVSNPNIHKDVTELKGSAIYFSSSTDELDIDAYGANLDYLFGAGERFGINGVFTMMGMTGDSSGDMSMDMSGFLMSVGGNILYEILQGEHKDAAGEITKISWGLTVYAGLTYSASFFSISSSIDDPVLGSMDMDMDIVNSEMTGMSGLVAQIPLGKRLQIVPYGGYNVMFGGTSSYDVTVNGTTYSDSESIDSYDYPVYGADIVLRPFRNNPNWKISLGTVMAQISNNDSDNLMIMLGVTYEKGKHYSETLFGPVVQ